MQLTVFAQARDDDQKRDEHDGVEAEVGRQVVAKEPKQQRADEVDAVSDASREQDPHLVEDKERQHGDERREGLFALGEVAGVVGGASTCGCFGHGGPPG